MCYNNVPRFDHRSTLHCDGGCMCNMKERCMLHEAYKEAVAKGLTKTDYYKEVEPTLFPDDCENFVYLKID